MYYNKVHDSFLLLVEYCPDEQQLQGYTAQQRVASNSIRHMMPYGMNKLASSLPNSMLYKQTLKHFAAHLVDVFY